MINFVTAAFIDFFPAFVHHKLFSSVDDSLRLPQQKFWGVLFLFPIWLQGITIILTFKKKKKILSGKVKILMNDNTPSYL